MKTLYDWQNDERNRTLDDFLRINDTVDDKMVDYFRDILPPRYNSITLVQVGEPYSSAKTETGSYRNTYSTFSKENGNWVYKGVCFGGETINRDLQHEFTKAERLLVGVYDDVHADESGYIRITNHAYSTYFIIGSMSNLKVVESRLNTALRDISLSRESLNNDIKYDDVKYMRDTVYKTLIEQIKHNEKSTFIDDCLNLKATPSDIDKYIKSWHENNTNAGKKLYEFLGMTQGEYIYVFKHPYPPAAIKEVLKQRNKDNEQLKKFFGIKDESTIKRKNHTPER